MKAVILAGGLGTRLAEETSIRPKPMVEIGGKPILWHIMKIYAAQGVSDFVVCLGHKGYVIKEFFANYFMHMSDVTFDLAENRMEVHRKTAEPWRVTLVDTGERTQTGGRLKRVRDHLAGEDVFAVTYGDGLADLDLAAERKFHAQHGRLATVCAVHPDSRFGALQMQADRVVQFREKPQEEGGWINGGFFLLSPQVLDMIEGDETVFEREPLERLAARDELRAYRHHGFWQPMDTLRDKNVLEEHWSSGAPPWRNW